MSSATLDDILSIIGISAHDSCDWTLNSFREVFQDRYADVIVGKEITIGQGVQ